MPNIWWSWHSNHWRQVEKSEAQQIRDVYTMLVQCWPAVYDVAPTLNQHWVNVSCLMGRYFQAGWVTCGAATMLSSEKDGLKTELSFWCISPCLFDVEPVSQTMDQREVLVGREWDEITRWQFYWMTSGVCIKEVLPTHAHAIAICHSDRGEIPPYCLT